MMMSMICSTIYKWMRCKIFSVMNHDCPELNEYKQEEVREFLQWENKGEKMIWNRLKHQSKDTFERSVHLRVSIYRMKSVRSEGCWNDPSMMRFMESFI